MKKLLLISVSAAFLMPPANNAQAGHSPVVVFEPGLKPPVGANRKEQVPERLGLDDPDLVFEVVSNLTTSAVNDAISLSISICSSGAQEYLVSCLGGQLLEIANALPDTGDYAQSAKIIEDAGRKLQALARQNRTRSKPVVRFSASTSAGTVTTGPLIAVATASLPSVNQQAAAILQEAETLLLRSVTNSDRRKSHYETIAAVVGSGKVLLRSL